jgi:uncharacterized membrane protein YfcA
MNLISVSPYKLASTRRKWQRRALAVLAIAACATFCAPAFEGMATADQRIWVTVLLCAAVSSIAGFAFSALAGSVLFHFSADTLYIVQVMLVASVAVQSYSVWKLRPDLRAKPLVPYFAGGLLTILPGIYLLLRTPGVLYTLVLGAFLIGYALFMLVRPAFRLPHDSTLARLIVGALGGITGATAAFPGAFITIWCGAQGWDKRQQRAIYQPFILGMQLLTLLALSLVQQGQGLHLDVLKFATPALLGAYCGLRVFEGLSTAQFNRIIAAFLLVSGIALALRAS